GCIVDGTIECPRHGARFCLKSGEVMAPPAYEGIHVFPVDIRNGEVWVRDDRWD
ncbi:MAG: nitrite reductase (NAD(P)H) small subunit, partial [Arenicellales bacterium]